jgi:predicted component of type VI protein secretion system
MRLSRRQSVGAREVVGARPWRPRREDFVPRICVLLCLLATGCWTPPPIRVVGDKVLDQFLGHSRCVPVKVYLLSAPDDFNGAAFPELWSWGAGKSGCRLIKEFQVEADGKLSVIPGLEKDDGFVEQIKYVGIAANFQSGDVVDTQTWKVCGEVKDFYTQVVYLKANSIKLLEKEKVLEKEKATSPEGPQ